MMVICLAAGVSATLSSGCDLRRAHVASFGFGYLFGWWEATRVELVTTERICYQDGVQIPCPSTPVLNETPSGASEP